MIDKKNEFLTESYLLRNGYYNVGDSFVKVRKIENYENSSNPYFFKISLWNEHDDNIFDANVTESDGTINCTSFLQTVKDLRGWEEFAFGRYYLHV